MHTFECWEQKREELDKPMDFIYNPIYQKSARKFKKIYE